MPTEYFPTPIITKTQWRKLLAKAKGGDPDAQWEVGYHYEEGGVTKSARPVVRLDQ